MINIKFCPKCKGTKRILQQRLSEEYANSFDYYPVPCPECNEEKESFENKRISLNSYVMR